MLGRMVCQYFLKGREVGALVLCNCMKEEASKKADGGVKGSFSIPMTLPNNRYEGFLLGALSDRAALAITLSVRPYVIVRYNG